MKVRDVVAIVLIYSVGIGSYQVGVWMAISANSETESALPQHIINSAVRVEIEPGYSLEQIRQITAKFVSPPIWEDLVVEINARRQNVLVADQDGRLDNRAIYLPSYAQVRELSRLESYVGWQNVNPQCI